MGLSIDDTGEQRMSLKIQVNRNFPNYAEKKKHTKKHQNIRELWDS